MRYLKGINEKVDEHIINSDIFDDISMCFIDMLDNKSIRFRYDKKEDALIGESYIHQKYDGSFNSMNEYLEKCKSVSDIFEGCLDKLSSEYDVKFRFNIAGCVATLRIYEIIKK